MKEMIYRLGYVNICTYATYLLKKTLKGVIEGRREFPSTDHYLIIEQDQGGRQTQAKGRSRPLERPLECSEMVCN